MAPKNSRFQSSKIRSLSSPELQLTSSGEASDENIKHLLNELADFKEQIATSSKSEHVVAKARTDSTEICVESSTSTIGNGEITKCSTGESPLKSTPDEPSGRNHLLMKGFKMLTQFLSRRPSNPIHGKRKLSAHRTNDVDIDAGARGATSSTTTRTRQQRSKSVCSTLVNRIRIKTQKQLSHTTSSSSDDSDSDDSVSNSLEPENGNSRKKQRRRDSKTKTKATSSKGAIPKELNNDKLLEHAVSEDKGATDGSVEQEERTSELTENNESTEIATVPSLYRPVVVLADMQRSHHQVQLLQSQTPAVANDIPNTPSIPQVVTITQNLYAHYDSFSENGTFSYRTVHTQIDYMHCLIPDQWRIINAPFYWGQINRFEADKLLVNKPEGTFILRDSTQDEFVFSVSFRRYSRTLHARIEQWNHKFTFDAHDPGVHSSKTVCGLLEHYKDPSYCMFYEPMLTAPLLKKNPQSLQELCRARICNRIKYNDISSLGLPIAMREYLRVYHYKQRVRVRKMEVDCNTVEENHPGVITNTCLSSVHSIVL